MGTPEPMLAHSSPFHPGPGLLLDLAVQTLLSCTILPAAKCFLWPEAAQLSTRTTECAMRAAPFSLPLQPWPSQGASSTVGRTASQYTAVPVTGTVSRSTAHSPWPGLPAPRQAQGVPCWIWWIQLTEGPGGRHTGHAQCCSVPGGRQPAGDRGSQGCSHESLSEGHGVTGAGQKERLPWCLCRGLQRTQGTRGPGQLAGTATG